MLEQLISSHRKILEDYVEIKRKFQELSKDVIKQLLGEYYHRFAKTVKQLGDGYPLRHIPQNLGIWKNPHVAPVIIIYNFPNLDAQSCFDPFVPITHSRYWVETKGLTDNISIDGKNYRIVFLIYEIDAGAHGITLSSAERNQKILSYHRIDFNRINKDIVQFLESLLEFYNFYGRHILIFTNSQRKNFNSEVQRLLRHPRANHIKAKLIGKNMKLMGIISDYLKKDIREILKKKYGAQGESPEHKNLKDWIMDHPEEIGISNVDVVYKDKERAFLYTGDLADVYFELTDGRYVVVEVETTNAFPGAFQALKYKVLKCAELGIDIKSDKVIPVLVAWRIPQNVKNFCRKYGIQCVERKI